MLRTVPESVNFAQEEVKILELWDRLKAFETTLEQSKDRPKFTFYDGPPFATGLPHYGHILAGTIKDIVTRFAHGNGFHVERRFGWDCHGLPVEHEIDKTLNIKGPEDVAAMGIEAYNAACRGIVMRYSSEWQKSVTRLGRWIDFENDYKTLYPWFMESVWWVFKQLYDKGLVYRGVKVMPFSTACNTPLSNFESGQNYKEVVDPTVIVSFPLDEDPTVNLLAWTTTPWTLPSNLTLCVNPNLTYVKLRDKKAGKIFVMMKDRLEILYHHKKGASKTELDYEIISEFLGKDLEGKGYEPLMPYFRQMKQERNAFRVLCDSYVTNDSGTGIVHQAPYFGEDDFRVCLANEVITKDMKPVCPVDDSGKFTEEVSDFKGLYVKDADKLIIKYIKNMDRLVNQANVKHSYPFCWRSDTPLIYKAVPSWFVRVEVLIDKLLANNAETYWVPEFVKEKRFANWLKSARDWAISRSRYWGTPIPLWISEDGEEIVCVGSMSELEQLTGIKPTDLHREFVDKMTIPSKKGKGTLKRVLDVFDCWFESGSMPYAQQHYPFAFENKLQDFHAKFPADFIAEGIDQTRGWFYTLMVLSTALFDRPPFKNLICNGLVLASDGTKMSKRKKNYPDPNEIFDKYGADALRLYLIDSPVVRSENLRFREEGVRDIQKNVFLPWYNAYRFLVQNVQLLEKESNEKFYAKLVHSDNVLDKWIMSYTHNLVSFVKKEMAAYRLYTVVPKLVKYFDILTNWYVRFNRKRLKGDCGKEECFKSLETLAHVLLLIIRLMSPFTPFITELMWQNLKHMLHDETDIKSAESIHYILLPEPDPSLIDEEIERKVAVMQSVVDLTRVLRDRKTLPIKYPLKEIVVVHQDQRTLEDAKFLESYILEEVNVRKMVTSSEKDRWGVKFTVDADYKTLGPRLGKDLKVVVEALKQFTEQDLEEMRKNGDICCVHGHDVTLADLKISYKLCGGQSDTYEADSDGNIIVLLDVTGDKALQDEGLAREIVNRIQKLRKKAKLVPQDDIVVYCSVDKLSDELGQILTTQKEYIEQNVKQPLMLNQQCNGQPVIIDETTDIKGANLHITLTKRNIS